MPIYEFKCSKCEEFFEILQMSSNDDIKCPKCESYEFQRVVSATNYTIGHKGSKEQASTQTRNCSAGSCTTYTVPGMPS